MRAIGDAVLNAMTNAQNAAKAIRDFSTSLNLGSLSALDPDAKYREAKRAFEGSDGSDTQLVQAFLQASKDRGADEFYYQRDFAAAQEKLAQRAAGLDDYAARLPAFFQAISQPAPMISPVATPPVLRGGMSKSSAQEAPAEVSQLKGEMSQMRETNERMADSMSKLTELIDRVSNGGTGLILEGA
jgi:hypothetical protein